MASAMPPRGHIVDLGAGWGLLSLALCAGSADRHVIGIDHDPARIAVATKAATRLRSTSRPVFKIGEVSTHLETVPDASLDGIAMIDVLHYFDPAIQLSLIVHAARSLKAGGVLLARDIDADDGLTSAFNKLYERLATGIGFTKSANRRMSFRGRSEWSALLESAGFAVESTHSGPPFLADVLFIATKKL